MYNTTETRANEEVKKDIQRTVENYRNGLSPICRLQYDYATARIKRVLRHRKSTINIAISGGTCALLVTALELSHSNFQTSFGLLPSSPLSGWSLRVAGVTLIALTLHELCANLWYKKEDDAYESEFKRLSKDR